VSASEIIFTFDEVIKTRRLGRLLFPSLQLGTGKTAGWLSGCPVGWLVSHVAYLSAQRMRGASRAINNARLAALGPAVSWAPRERAHELPARRYASTVFATATCLSVCLSVRLSHAGIVPSRAKAGS